MARSPTFALPKEIRNAVDVLRCAGVIGFVADESLIAAIHRTIKDSFEPLGGNEFVSRWPIRLEEVGLNWRGARIFTKAPAVEPAIHSSVVTMSCGEFLQELRLDISPTPIGHAEDDATFARRIAIDNESTIQPCPTKRRLCSYIFELERRCNELERECNDWAQRAYDDAEPVELSDERIAEIVKFATGKDSEQQ